jgi:hypothetical protein
VASVRKTSDFDFFRDFERDFDRASRAFELSRAFVAGSWGPHLLNVEVSDQETFRTGQPNVVDRRLPEIDYSLRSTKLGRTPLALQLESSLGYLSQDRSPTLDARYGRFHAVPQLSLPVNPAAWLSLELFAGERFTWWSDSLDATGQAFTGESLSRSAPFAGAGLIGPSFARLYSRGGGGGEEGGEEGEAVGKKGFGKFLHVVEPRFTYRWQDAYEDQGLVPRFDTVDEFAAGNVGTIALINRLKAKPRDEQAGGGARDIVTFEISRRYSFDQDEPLERDPAAGASQFGPYLTSLRVNPGQALILEASATYSGLFDRLTSAALSTDLRFERGRLGVRWNSSIAGPSGETLSDQYRFSAGLEAVPKRLLLQAWVNYDAERALLQEQRYFLDYNSQCYSLHLELREYSPGDLRERDYRLSFTLKNVGSFIDLTGRFE